MTALIKRNTTIPTKKYEIFEVSVCAPRTTISSAGSSSHATPSPLPRMLSLSPAPPQSAAPRPLNSSPTRYKAKTSQVIVQLCALT